MEGPFLSYFQAAKQARIIGIIYYFPSLYCIIVVIWRGVIGMLIKMLTIFSISLGLVLLYEVKTNRSQDISASSRECTVKVAIKSVRFGDWSTYLVLLNILLVSLVIIYNL